MTTDPSAEMYRLINGYQISQAIYAAVHLGVADHLKDGRLPHDQLAILTRSHPGTLYRLLRALAAADVLHEHEGGSFSLTPLGDCLRSDSASPVGAWAAFVGRPYMWQAWGHLLHSVLTGDNAFTDLNKKSVWQFRSEHPDEGAIFDRAMTALSKSAVDAILRAYDFSKFDLIADIGGGQGQTLAGIMTANTQTRGILFDQPHVVEKATSILASAGLEGRCEIIGGSFFEAVPSGADAYILRAILHDWEDEEAALILKACRRAMCDTGRLLIIERVIAPPNEGLIGKFSDLNMLVSPGGRERTREEFSDLCGSAGFKVASVVAAGPMLSVIEAWPR
jgi:hypothetical protein